MTKPALVSQADLMRMAAVAKRTGMTVWVEVEGRKYGVSPPTDDNKSKKDAEIAYGGTSLAEWRERRPQRPAALKK